MTDPDHLLRQYGGKLAGTQRKSEAVRETMAGLRVTERSADGQIAVTVNDAGNLVDLHLGEALRRKEGQAVAQEVLRVVQAAQSRVAATVQEAMTPLLGGDSQAMSFMVDRLHSAQPPVAGGSARSRTRARRHAKPRRHPDHLATPLRRDRGTGSRRTTTSARAGSCDDLRHRPRRDGVPRRAAAGRGGPRHHCRRGRPVRLAPGGLRPARHPTREHLRSGPAQRHDDAAGGVTYAGKAVEICQTLQKVFGRAGGLLDDFVNRGG